MKIHWAVLACAMLALAACQRPQPAPTEQKPEPQATALRDHIQQPLDKARGVQAATDQAAAQQRATIDAATQ
ncbi:hypothetical protein [Xanthomonas campestris]|uniref:hypothetical protein n=1 Tax=Xanthomonas campestris TaxID=339 RepID=UPI000E1EC26E|nr:hypothetical protein [Xanthomonas campestris]